MRPSIRNQILVPLIAIQVATVCAISAATAALAARRSERQVMDRLRGVIEAVGHGNFPYTGSVLARMRGLSGAEFAVHDDDGNVMASTLPALRDRPTALSPASTNARIDTLGESPMLELGGVRYLAVTLRPPSGSPGPSLLVLYPESSWRQARREAATVPLLLGTSSLGLMVTVTSWIAIRLGRRIRALGLEVARIADGDFGGLDTGPRRDEIAELAHSINAMCDQLRDMSQQIGRTERTRLLAQLAAGLAHQMRNSLTGARMSIQLHARRCPGPEQDRSLDVALGQLTMTEEQVKGLLSLGRVERRPRSACDLGRLVREVLALVGPVCEHGGVTLTTRLDAGPFEVTADARGLRAAVLNLTLNAIEAAGRGGTVGLRVSEGAGRVEVEVTDTGPGPPPGLADSLFEPFTTGKPEGVGLGLALAHEVACEHQGELSWKRVDGETRFVLSIPQTHTVARDAG